MLLIFNIIENYIAKILDNFLKFYDGRPLTLTLSRRDSVAKL